ncbi:MAG: hypothetical protein ACYDHF_04260 [Candidatus Cryosericum sp.]
MMQSRFHVGRRRLLVTILVGGLILAGSVFVTLVTRNGGLRPSPVFASGTVVELSSASTGKISIVADNVEVVVGTSPDVTTTSILVGSEGFRRDYRATVGTYGLRFDSISSAETGVKRLTVVVPENGTLTLTLVGDARVVLDQAHLKKLQLAGASSALEVDASESGSIVDTVEIDNVTGGFTATRLGNLDMTSLIIGNITGTYDVDLSGSLGRHCDASLRTAVGNGTLRIPDKPGVQLSVVSVLGRVMSSGFVTEGERSFLNSSAAGGADRQLLVTIGSAVGQVQLVEVQQ